MARYVGTWVYDTAAAKGDYVQLMRLDARTEGGIGWGTAIGLGWTPTLQIRRPGDTTLVGIAGGSFEANATDPESAALFQIGNESTITFTAPATTLVPAVGALPNDFEGLLFMADPGGVSHGVLSANGEMEVFAFRVARFP